MNPTVPEPPFGFAFTAPQQLHVIHDSEAKPLYVYAPDWPAPEGLAWSFDLDAPISMQLRRAKDQLERAQMHKHGSLIQRNDPLSDRKRKTDDFVKWARYLRVSDAAEEGVRDREVLSVLYPGGGKTASNLQADREAAKKLKANFPA